MGLKGFSKSKRGSFTVLAAMIFCAVLVLTTAAIKAAGYKATASAADSFGRLWGKSILAEYDVFLRDRYGIFGFYGDNDSVAGKLKFYANYTASEKSYVTVENTEADVEAYRLDKPENVKPQIESIVLHGEKPVLRYGALKGSTAAGSAAASAGTSGSAAGAAASADTFGHRRITAEWIKNSLPSAGKTGSLSLEGLAGRIKAGLGLGDIAGRFASDRYIGLFFRNYMDGKGLDDTYFRCETEYIISGKLSDEDALKSAGSKIKGLRNLLNLYYLYTCAEKREAALAMAELITPGPMSVLTQAVILETWAYAEAGNDLKILYGGETVPLLKKDRNWALSLENVFNSDGQVRAALTEARAEKVLPDGAAGETSEEGGEDKDYVSPQVTEGIDYSSYLNVLLAGMAEDTKLLRAMDLIQINAKYNYCDYFSLKDHCGGLSYVINVNGNEYKFKETY